MIYKELYEIPLRRFIEMYCGDLNALVIEGKHEQKELEETASMLILKYNQITGNKSAEADVFMRNDMLNYNAKIHCMEAVLWLIGTGSYKEACAIMASFKYNCKCDTEDDVKAMKGKAEGLLSESRMRLDMLISKISKDKKEGVKVDRDYFEREKAIVMSYFKYSFDDNEVNAQTYANWLNIMSEQVKEMKSKRE